MKSAELVHQELIRQKKWLALSESCTGGAIAARLTEIPGASLFLLGSIVAYSNKWKEQFLQVRAETLARFGAESEETVEEMIMGLFSQTKADFVIGVSGFAGPGGGTKQNPVGTVFIAVAERGKGTNLTRLELKGGRKEVIDHCVEKALEMLLSALKGC